MKSVNKHVYFLIFALPLLFIILLFNTLEAKITSNCSNCHTMHNSQNGTSMNFNGNATPNQILLRGDCIGCHGKGTANNIDPNGNIPQVIHTNITDLAGGNFAYITGAKSRVTADQNSAGHNVIDLGPSYKETVLQYPPGLSPLTGHDRIITNNNLTCAGKIGCHGKRGAAFGTGLTALKGAHHQNVDGKCNTVPVAATASDSYRFLVGVEGLENTGTYKWQNHDANNHNEYFGTTAPLALSCSATSCHGSNGVYSPNGSISSFCATCHGQFHNLSDVGTSSPFIRHPTDVVLPNSGEYSAYTTYSVEAPVARTTVPDSASSTVTPGTDVVMCLSCHAAHATPYADILRWNYNGMVAGGSGSGGCFTCHTQKKNP